VGYLDFCVAARCGSVHGSDDTTDMRAQDRPLRVFEDKNGDPSPREVLLVADVLVGRDKNLKARGFRFLKQGSIRERFPSALHSFDDRMGLERVSQRRWRAVIKQNEHVPGKQSPARVEPAGRDFVPRIRGRSRSALA
jgi:hypothetical protein